MKNISKNIQFIIRLSFCCLMAILLGGCRQDVKYFLYYPHSVLGAVQPSADRQEFSISPLNLEKNEFLVVTFIQDGRTICHNDLSEIHLCSPAAQAEYKRLLEEYRHFLVYEPQNNSEKLKIINREMTNTVEQEPLPDLQIELLTESGEVEIYEMAFTARAEGQKLPFDFHECNYSSWDRAKLKAGVDRDNAQYSDAEKNSHHRKCEESRAKTFVKMRVRSPAGMNVESIKLENYYSPFSIR